ncbi:MAG: glycosyltransferase family 2 protein [Paludibacter sp.]|nr:glycosyltransferase family 2 protein [Paludibacter sp.]
MDMLAVKISVIIPIYNDELYLRDALYSIQQQTFENFECICVNDGSVDQSEEIIDDFVKNDKRFLKINRENGGVSAARNTGLDAAKGEYIFMMDHDDLIPNYTLEKLLNAAQKYNADMSRGRMMMIAEDFSLQQLPTDNIQNKKEHFYQNPLTDYYRHIRHKNKNWYYVWMCLFKRSVIHEIHFLDELRSGGEDNLFTFEVVSKIKNFVQITDIVACHRYSKISVTLNGYNPALFFNISEIIIPHIFQKYALDTNIDKRLLWWVYRKESYAIYRFLIRNPIRLNELKYLEQARQLLLNHEGSSAFNEIIKRWNFRQKIFFRLFIKGKYGVIKRFEIFM